MKKKIIPVLIAAAISLIVFRFGFVMGYKRGARLGYERGAEALQSLVSDYDIGRAVELHNRVKLLKNIRTGEIEKSNRMLEYLVDNDVSYLGVYLSKHIPPVEKTDKRIIAALQYAEKYREQYPDKAMPLPDKLKKEVEKTFKRIGGLAAYDFDHIQ